MIVEIRKSISGTEYWDAENKKTIFVSKDHQPDFEIVDDPESMVTAESPKVTIHVDSEKIVEKVVEKIKETEPLIEKQEESDTLVFEDMKMKELRDYAKNNNITIPGAIKSKGDIIALILEAE